MKEEQREAKAEERLKAIKSKRGLLSFFSVLHKYCNILLSKKMDLTHAISLGETAIQPFSSDSNGNGVARNEETNLDAASGVAPKKGMVLPFTPLAMAFDDVRYYVDMPGVRIKTQSINY